MRAQTQRALRRLDHLRPIVSEQQRSVPADVVDVLVAIDVPLPRAGGALHVHRPRRERANVVRDTGREDAARALCERARTCMHRFEGLEDCCHVLLRSLVV